MKKLSWSLVIICLVSLVMNLSVEAEGLGIEPGYYQYTEESMVKGLVISEEKFKIIYDTVTAVEEDTMVPILFKWGNAVNNGVTSLIDPNIKSEELDSKNFPKIEIVLYDYVAPFPQLAMVLTQPSIYSEGDIFRVRIGDAVEFEWEFKVGTDGTLTDQDNHTFKFVGAEPTNDVEESTEEETATEAETGTAEETTTAAE